MTVDATDLARAAAPVKRPLAADVHRVIAAQQLRLAPSAAREAHVRALATGAACIVTGQQVGLFLGPLYTIYKAASAVVLARRLGAVPVFWMQTEDHDLPEISSAGLVGEKVSVAVDSANRVSIAHLVLPDPSLAIERVATAIGDGPNARAHVERLRRHYRAGVRWADAFAGMLSELFDELVIVDPRDPTFAAHVMPVHRRAIADAERIAAMLAPEPVHVRPGAPLSFFHPDGPLGPRMRIDGPVDGEPMQFSTSALLRLIVQDTLLPTVAYVGGPAEVAYAQQAAPLYRVFDMVQPPTIRRASFTIVDVRMRALLDRLGLSAADAARPESELLARARRDGVTSSDVVERLYRPFADALVELELPGADKELARTRASVERAIGKLARVADRRDTELVDAVRRLRATLAPGGAPQERVLSLSAFAARDGDRALVERVLAAVDPFDPTMKELS